MAVLFNKTYLNPNHYFSDWKIEDIQVCIEESCSELQVDVSYEQDIFSYYCISYHQYLEICFWIHLFRDGYNLIVELEHRSGDAFGYVKIVSELRYLFQQKNMIYTNFEPYKKPIDLIYEDISPDYIRSLIQYAHSSVESVYVLAQLSLLPDVQQTMVDPFVLEQLIQLSMNIDVNVHRCALAIIGNLLHSPDSDLVSSFLQEHKMIDILDKRMSSNTIQVKRECNLIYPFLDKK